MRSADGPQEGSGRPLSSWAARSCRASLPRDRTGSQLGQELLCKPAGVSPEASSGLGTCTQLSPGLLGAHRPGHRTQEKGKPWTSRLLEVLHACGRTCLSLLETLVRGGGLSGSPLASEIAFQVRWPGIPRSGHWQYGADGRCGPALACDSPHRSLSGVPSRTDTSEVPTTAMHRRAGALGGLRGKKEPRGPWRRALAGGAGLFAEAHSHWAAERPPPGEGGSTARAVRPGTQTREI